MEADLYLEIKGRCGRFGNFVENFSLIDLVLISGKKIISLQFFITAVDQCQARKPLKSSSQKWITELLTQSSRGLIDPIENVLK